MNNLNLDRRGIQAAGRVEHHGLQIGTATAEKVVLAYKRALVAPLPESQLSESEPEAGDVSAIIDLFTRLGTSAAWIRIIRTDQEPCSIDDIIYLEQTADAELYDTRPGYVDVVPGRITQLGRCRSGPDEAWQLRLYLMMRCIVETWPTPRVVMLAQRILGERKNIVGMVLELAYVADYTMGVGRGEAAFTNFDVIFRYARLLDEIKPSESESSSQG